LSVTVRDVLNMPELKDARILAGGNGLNCRVSNVNVMEAPDIVRWLHGGEFLLTSAYAFRDDPREMLPLLRQMKDAGVSALGIKLKRFIEDLPGEFLLLADELSLPVLELPSHLAFGDVIFPILSKIVDESVGDVRFSEAILRSFYTLMASGGNIHQILYTIRSFLREDVAYLDVKTGERHVCSSQGDFEDKMHSSSVQDIIRTCFSEAVVLSGKVYGYIVVAGNREEEVDRQWGIVLEHAKSAVLVCTQREMVAKEIERRYRDEFVQDLLFRNIRFERELWARAARFDWDFSGPFQVVVVDIDDYKFCLGDPEDNPVCFNLDERRNQVVDLAVNIMRSHYPKIPYTTMTDMVVFLTPLRDDGGKGREPLDRVLPKVRSTIGERTGFSVTIGIGAPKESCFLCHESYEEAKEAISTIRPLLGGDREVHWSRMGMYAVLAKVSDLPESERFYREQLAPLLDLKGDHREDMMSTLRALIQNNWSLRKTASNLSIHYNTLRYRLDKIQELMKSDINSGEERLSVALAVKLYTLAKERQLK